MTSQSCFKKKSAVLLLLLSFLAVMLSPSKAAVAAGIHATAQINAFFTNSVYHYTITLNNTGVAGDASINTFWYAWTPGQDYLPSSPTNLMSPGAWVASVTHEGSGDGYGIQ